MTIRELKIREMKKEDTQIAAELFRKLVSFLQKESDLAYFRFELPHARALRFTMTNILKSDNQTALLAKIDGKTVGLMTLEIRNPFVALSPVKDVGYIAAVFVEKEYRGLGVASELLNEAKAWFEARGVRYLELNVLTQNTPGKSAWEALGFQSVRELMVLHPKDEDEKI